MAYRWPAGTAFKRITLDVEDCNQRVFGTALRASIALFKTTLSASETAIIRMGLQSIAPGPHYLHLNSVTQQTRLACPSRSPVLRAPAWNMGEETVVVSQ